MPHTKAHFANEYAEWFKSARRWDEAFAKFQHAFDIAGLADEAAQPALKARALRGMSFTRSELGKFDEAEKFLRRSMEFEPDNPAARHELEYIAEQRGKPKT